VKKKTNRNNKEPVYINYHRTNRVSTRPIFFLAKTSLLIFKIVLGRSKLNCICNGFYIIRFKQFHEEAIDNDWLCRSARNKSFADKVCECYG